MYLYLPRLVASHGFRLSFTFSFDGLSLREKSRIQGEFESMPHEIYGSFRANPSGTFGQRELAGEKRQKLLRIYYSDPFSGVLIPTRLAQII